MASCANVFPSWVHVFPSSVNVLASYVEVFTSLVDLFPNIVVASQFGNKPTEDRIRATGNGNGIKEGGMGAAKKGFGVKECQF